MKSAALVLQTSPLLLTVVLGLLALSLHWIRELRVLFLLVVLSSLLNVALKALVRQARPGPWPANCSAVPCFGVDCAATSFGMPSGHAQLSAAVPCFGVDCAATSFGMPSGHAQLSSAVAVYLLLAIYARPGCMLVRGLATLLCLGLLLGVPFSRTRMAQAWQLGPVGAPSTGCHSMAQVLVGSAVGAALGAAAWCGWGRQEEEED